MLPETQMKIIQDKGNMLSLEAAVGNESFDSAMQQLPEFLTSVKTLFSSLTFTSLDSAAYYGSPLDKTVQKVSKMDFLDFTSVTLPVPEGLIVPYVEYQQKLLGAAKHVQLIDAIVLRPFQQWLGRGLGSPSALASVTSSLKLDVNKEEAAITRLERDLVSCFNAKGTRASDVPYTTALRNQRDWATIRDGQRELEKIFDEEFEKGMSKRLKEIDVLLTTLIMRVEEKKQGYDLSPKTLTELANTSRLIAREFEYYSIVRYRVDIFTQSINEAVEKLKAF